MRKLIQNFNRYLFLLTTIFVFIAVIVTLIDATSRYFGQPFLGAIEINKFCLVIICTWCWAHTQAKKGHIIIDIVYTRMPSRLQNVANVVTTSIALFIVSLFTWQAAVWALLSFQQKEWTIKLQLPNWPFKAMVALGLFLLGLQLILDLIDYFKASVRKRHGNPA